MGRSAPGVKRGTLTAPEYERPDPAMFSHRADKTPFDRAAVFSIDHTIDRIDEFLRAHKIRGRVLQVKHGASATQYILDLESGERCDRLFQREGDLQLALVNDKAVVSDAGGVLSIDLPEAQMSEVTLLDLWEHPLMRAQRSELPVLALGRTADGYPATVDLSKTPHLLIGGATGSGKSVGLASIIQQLMLLYTPSELELTLIDTKRTEFGVFEDVPHLDPGEVLYDANRAGEVIRAIDAERDERNRVLKDYRVQSVANYLEAQRARGTEPQLPFPIRVIVIDEFGDFASKLSTSAVGVERSEQQAVFAALERIASLGRTVAVHLVLATQRPRAELMPTWIRNNFTARLAFHCAEARDSAQILGEGRGEAAQLQEHGDAYLQSESMSVRMRGTFVAADERDRLIEWWRRQGTR